MIPRLIFCPGPGQTIPIANGKGAAATPDYKALYFELFRANEQAIRLLYMHGQPAHNAKGSPFGGAGSANGAD